MTDSPRYCLSADLIGDADKDGILTLLRSNRYTMGEMVCQFEKGIADWVGAEHAVMVNSGSSANLLLVNALITRLNAQDAPLKRGDEVLVPALAWPTTVWPLVQLGLVPVFVDVDPQTLAIDLASAASVLSPRTRGVFLIHVLGQACRMQPYVDFCREHGLTLIEDCCESFGAFDRGNHVGTFGMGGTLSHYFSHHLTTIEGGTVIVNDKSLADDLRSMRAHGWIRERSDREVLSEKYAQFDPRFLFVLPGYNVRPMELQAAIGLAQLSRMDADLASRDGLARRVAGWSSAYAPWCKLLGTARLSRGAEERRRRSHSWMMLPFCLADDAPMAVNEVKQAFEDHCVETRALIAGNLTRHPAAAYGESRCADSLRVADQLLERGFMIGCHPNAHEEQIALIEQTFKILQRRA